MGKWRTRLRWKFFLAILFGSLVMIVLPGGVTLYISGHKLNENTQNLAMELLEQLSDNMEANTDSLLNATYNFMSDETLQEMLLTDTDTIYEMGLMKYRQQIRTIGSRYFSTKSPVYAVYVKNQEDVSCWWMKYSSRFYYADVTEDYADNILKLARRQMEEIGSNTCWFTDDSDRKIYLARNILHTGKNLGKAYATAVFAVDSEFFMPVSENKTLVSNQELVFQNRATGMTYTDAVNEGIAGLCVEQDHAAYGRDILAVTYNGAEYLWIKYASRDAQWNLYCAIPKDKYQVASSSLMYPMLGVTVAALLISLAISYIISGSMTQNIRHLEKNISRVEEGDFSVHIDPASNDEIGQLCHHFNHMADRIEELVQQAYREGEEKEKLKLTVLKAQINPHFLYNSLGSIKCLAKMEGKDNIAEMTTALIDLLRASLGKTGEFQTVEQEVEYIRNYFVLQLYRYENAFTVRYNVAEETRHLLMLNFILQPLVENALFHGIELSRKNGIITVSSCVREGRLFLTVEDNGVGMTKEQMDTLFQEKDDRYEGLNSIGVGNVYRRIQRYFGQEYGLRYFSSPGKGCRVEILLPVFETMKEVKTNV